MFEQNEAREWLKEAGKLAWNYYRKAVPSATENKTYVKEVDLIVQNFLLEKN